MIAAEVKYKKTGIDWIPEVPKHWEIVRLKNIVQINANKLSEQTPKNTLINYIDITNVNGDGDILEVQQLKFKDSPSRARRLLKKNDTIISTVRTYLKAITAIRNDNFVGSTGFAVLTPDIERLNPDFLYYYVSSKAFVNKVMVNSVGVAYPAITPTTLACLPFLLPPIEEQNRIVEILNSESVKITRFIKTKQRFIELLKEQRQSIITNAVTKGIDDGAKMKETGVDWMPEVPEHWILKRGNWVYDLGKEIITKEELLSVKELLHYSIPSIQETGKPAVDSGDTIDSNKQIVKPGDLLVSKLNPRKKTIIIVENDDDNRLLVASTEFVNLRCKDVYTEFAFYLYQSHLVTERISSTVQSSTNSHQRAYPDTIYKMWNYYPPTIEEQKRIVEHIKTETHTLDLAISKAEREIELIKEYREAMIAEAVTGKIKL